MHSVLGRAFFKCVALSDGGLGEKGLVLHAVKTQMTI